MIGRATLAIGLAAAICIASASPAHAQWTGTRMGSNAKKSNPEELMQVTAECVAERGPAYAAQILEELPGSEEEFRLMRANEGDIGMCMDNSDIAVGSVEMTFTPRGFRRALAAEMLKLQLDEDFDAAVLAGGEAWFMSALEAAGTSASFDEPYLSNLEFGDCVVSRAPVEAIAYLRTKEGSKDEAEQLAGLMPSLSPCISSGQQIALTHESLRLALSEPTYHRLVRAGVEN